MSRFIQSLFCLHLRFSMSCLPYCLLAKYINLTWDSMHLVYDAPKSVDRPKKSKTRGRITLEMGIWIQRQAHK